MGMGNATQPWEQLTGEPSKWFDRFTQFCLLGPNRTLDAVYAKCARKPKSRKVAKRRGARASGVSKAWRDAVECWQWRARAAEWDKHERRKQQELYDAQQRAIMGQGYALQTERVAKLNAIAEQLWGDLQTPDKRWLPDAKSIGSGENAERIDFIRFNAPLFAQFRETLNDLALETNGRVRGVKLSGAVGVADLSGDDMAQLLLQEARIAEVWEAETLPATAEPPTA